MKYYFNKSLEISFDEAVAKVTEQLKKEGFGILTEIDVKETLKKKLDVDFQRYIILGACNGSFPLLHPDNALFEIFGKTIQDAFEEERRLFYVAMTRAKSSLYILTEKGRESVLLKYLPASRPWG